MPTQVRRTTCNRDCPDACGIEATVTDGLVTRLRGAADHPVTRGFLCYRTSHFLGRQNSQERLRHALLRKNGRLEPVSLTEALDFVAEKLLSIRAESGPAAILHYRSGGSLGLLKIMADRFFERFGPCSAKTGDICSGAGEAAQILDFGVSDSNDLFDLLDSRYIYLWGKNPFASNIHLIPVLKEARAKGAKLTLVDPVAHKGMSLVDRFVQPPPGTDLAIALGIGRILVERGWLAPDAREYCMDLPEYERLVLGRTLDEHARAAEVPVALLEQMAREFHQGPTAILVGWGMQRRSHGGAIVRALDALAAVSGNLFRSGGGCSFYFRRRGAFDSSALSAGETVAPRLLREPLLGQDILAAENPKIRAVWVTAGNPVCMLPDSATVARALEATELVVVADPFLTDTGRRATVVLPVPTLLEDDDLLGAYGHHWLGESRPVVPPPPGVLQELELFQALARRVGGGLVEAMAGTAEEWKRRLLRPVEPLGITLEGLREGPKRNPRTGKVRFPNRRVETPTGKVQLLGAVPAPVEVAPGYPFALFSNSTIESQASQWVGSGLGPHVWIAVHPEAIPGRKEGDLVTVESPTGALQAVLRFDPAQRKDVAIMPKGGHYDRGHSANALIAARATDLGLGAAYLDCRVRIS